MATSLLKEIVETRASNEDGNEVLSLVDTSFLIDPVWDSAKDPSHYDRNEAGLMETKYIILWKMFSERKNVVWLLVVVIVTGNKLQIPWTDT